ncbi:MAG: ABC transporter ATP-binding protein [Hyphomicrobiaceae bacterium]|nr:ABC transporter ATP-binding protein [Hyphomicrobiaceae bacterium]
MSPVPALSVRGLRAGYGRGGDIVCGIDLDQQPETILAVVGPNGSGKSTFVKTLAGLVPARAGSIDVTGTNVTRLSPAQRTAAGVAYVPQEGNIFRSMTVGENLKLATEFVRGRAGAGLGQLDLVLELFPEVANRRRLLAGNLSGGQRQMLAFACALLANPEVLLLDEPSAGLSPRFVQEIMQTVLTTRKSGVTIVLVEQNVTAALSIADEVAVLVAGVVARHCPAQALDDGELERLFMGRAA